MSANTAKPKRKRGPKLSALFLLGSDGEVYAASPMPSAPLPPHLAKKVEIIMAIRLNRHERDIVLDTIHTDGVIEAARTLAGILRPDA